MSAVACLVLNPVITISHILTSEPSQTIKKFKSDEFASKTTSPSEIIDNFLSKMVSPRLSAPE